MHKYLKSIGFGKVERKREVDLLLEDVKNHYDKKNVVKKEGI